METEVEIKFCIFKTALIGTFMSISNCSFACKLDDASDRIYESRTKLLFIIFILVI